MSALTGLSGLSGSERRAILHERIPPIPDFIKRRTALTLLGAPFFAPLGKAAFVLSTATVPLPVMSEPRLPARVLSVGDGQRFRSIREAAAAARDGDIVEIEAGTYAGDVAVWTQQRLTIRGVNGRPLLLATGASAEGKGIWVLRNGDFEIENISFSGARVSDRNGAGIRFERGRLVVRRCSFEDNENGILTGNDGESELVVEECEFVANGADDGYSHNLYAGVIGALSVRGSYFSRARAGHLIKSRARRCEIAYSRLTDERSGNASYELELANGGIGVVVGNLIQQGPGTENNVMISYGAEGYRWSENRLYLVHNTLVNEGPPHGVFLYAARGDASVRSQKNILVGPGSVRVESALRTIGDVRLAKRDFAAADRFDYRLRASSRGTRIVDLQDAANVGLTPTREYVHPARSRPLAAPPSLPGSFQSLAP